MDSRIVFGYFLRRLRRPLTKVVPGLAWLLAGLLTVLVTGCESSSVSRFVSPRVTGRVVDAATLQPIANAQVRRLTREERRRTSQQLKGAEVLHQRAPVRTDNDGHFVLLSTRSLTPFRSGWHSVNLEFRHAGYHPYWVGYTIETATNTPEGEPLVETGEIRLEPRKK